MVSTPVLLLQLLLVPVVYASHHFGGLATVFGGRNSDGTFTVNITYKATFDGCYYSQSLHCYDGNCGSEVNSRRGILDSSTNVPKYTRQWCEAETLITRRVSSNKPFSLRSARCCWIPTRNNLNSWRLLTTVDLGTRSDTGEPNKSPAIGTLPFLRVPQNCPRTYKLMAFDADGDRVRCRYGKILNTECGSCSQPVGFHLDQDSCTLYYNYTLSDPSVYGFELVVEDFPQQHVILSYSDGSHSSKSPLRVRRKRPAVNPYQWWPRTTLDPWWQIQTTTSRHAPSTGSPTTPIPPTLWSRWPTTTPDPWWRSQTTNRATPSTGVPTTSSPPPWGRWKTTTRQPWWWWNTQQTTRSTTAGYPTTMQQQTITPRPWWWWLYTKSTVAPTPPWWWHHSIDHFRPTTTPQYTPTSALSKLPLQFSLLVDPPVPSCQEGLYIPGFVYPTPQNGERIYAEVNKEVEIRVKAQAIYAKIHGIIMSGPINVNKHRTTHEEFVMRWIPRPEDMGRHYTLCFAVESLISESGTTTTEPSYHYATHHDYFSATKQLVYQSEMRCVLLEVQKETVKAKVTCTESSMTVEVEKASLQGIQVDHLRLSDPGNIECSLQRHSNSTHVIAVIPLNSCGTQLEEDDENLIFKNEINTVDNVHNIITRKHRLEVDFHCQYPKRGNVTQSFIGHRKTITVWEKGFGRFTYQFEFYPNDQFQSMISPTLYPLDYKLGTRIYMKIEASSSINNTELFVESCRAAPYDNPNFRPTYSIIEDGCAVDPTVQIYSSAPEHEFRFSIEAFQFIGLHDHVYISCSVLMCEAGNAYTRCSQGCINTKWTDSDHHHVKREAVIQTASHFVSQGPLRLKKSAESNESTVTNLNLNLIFIAGCLLAIVGTISTVVMYKVKMSSVKYQRLPTFES
ncbi:uncharacterized protein LOC133395932 [Phycodurus eques]|uniref:uncharacterized protein LOC133395932 n=1 Tax=Phycodurus eques TaxID=693459 RepID=UPI002ACDE8A3|nr:uncharacterized protein LOC133395932 [Phycodurus eques]